MPADDISVANLASESARTHGGDGDEARQSIWPEDEVRGGRQAPRETLDQNPRQPPDKAPRQSDGAAHGITSGARVEALSDPPFPPGIPPVRPDPDRPPPIEEPPRPIPVPPDEPPPPIIDPPAPIVAITAD